MSGVSGRENNVDTIRIAAEKRAIKIGACFNVYTDGSTSGGLLDGGAGVVVTRGNPTSPKVVKTIRQRDACFTCSYEDENRALEEAVHWLQTRVPQNFSVAVSRTPILYVPLCLKSLNAYNTSDSSLNESEKKITIQRIPRHNDILGNKMAKQLCSENPQLPGVTYTYICAQIKHVVKNRK